MFEKKEERVKSSVDLCKSTDVALDRFRRLVRERRGIKLGRGPAIDCLVRAICPVEPQVAGEIHFFATDKLLDAKRRLYACGEEELFHVGRYEREVENWETFAEVCSLLAMEPNDASVKPPTSPSQADS